MRIKTRPIIFKWDAEFYNIKNVLWITGHIKVEEKIQIAQREQSTNSTVIAQVLVLSEKGFKGARSKFSNKHT